jgi:hypothetical protein
MIYLKACLLNDAIAEDLGKAINKLMGEVEELKQ